MALNFFRICIFQSSNRIFNGFFRLSVAFMSQSSSTFRATPIPNYGLYGEAIDAREELGLHIEEIHERSRDEGWLIKPHYHGRLFQVICLISGSVEVHLDTKTYSIDSLGFVTVPMGTIHEFIFTPNTQGFVVTLTDNILTTIRQTQTVSFFDDVLRTPSVIQLGRAGDAATQLETYISLMRSELAEENAGRSASLTMLSALFLTHLSRHLDSERRSHVTTSPHARVLEQFKVKVDQNFRRHLSIKDYAEDLNTSTSTLNRVCRQHLNTSAKGFIAQRILAEARRRLIYTRHSLEEISYQLGFKDPAYFSRVFAKAEGLPPGAYRLRAQEGDLRSL